MGEKGTFVYRDQYHTGLGKQRRVNAMCELMEKFGEKKLEEGRLEGRTEGRIESARRTATALLALSQIAEATELSQEEVKRLAGTLGA